MYRKPFFLVLPSCEFRGEVKLQNSGCFKATSAARMPTWVLKLKDRLNH